MLITGKRLKKIIKTKNQTHKLFNKVFHKRRKKKRYKKKSFRRKNRGINLKKRSLKNLQRGGSNQDNIQIKVKNAVETRLNNYNVHSMELLDFMNKLHNVFENTETEHLQKLNNLTMRLRTETDDTKRAKLQKQIDEHILNMSDDGNDSMIEINNHNLFKNELLPHMKEEKIRQQQQQLRQQQKQQLLQPQLRQQQQQQQQQLKVARMLQKQKDSSRLKLGNKICHRLINSGNKWLCLERYELDRGVDRVNRLVYVGPNGEELYDLVNAPKNVASFIYELNKRRYKNASDTGVPNPPRTIEGWEPISKLIKQWNLQENNFLTGEVEKYRQRNQSINTVVSQTVQNTLNNPSLNVTVAQTVQNNLNTSNQFN